MGADKDTYEGKKKAGPSFPFMKARGGVYGHSGESERYVWGWGRRFVDLEGLAHLPPGR